MSVTISAVICTYNRERFIPGVLKSLAEQTIDISLVEIVFVNNNSTDNTKTQYDNFVASHPQIKSHYFEEINQGLSHARNRGIKESSGEYIAFIDDDAFLDKNYLKVVLEYFEKNKNVMALGGKILLHYEGLRPYWATKYIESLFGYFNLGDKEKMFNTSYYPRGSNMVFRKTCFEKYGNFNVHLGRIGNVLTAGEEKELFSRFIDKEKVAYLPSAIVYHLVPEARTKVAFVREQAINIGRSEKIRVSVSISKKISRWLSEIIKWKATFVLFVYYLLCMQGSKGVMLINFRYWISKGLFSSSKK